MTNDRPRVAPAQPRRWSATGDLVRDSPMMHLRWWVGALDATGQPDCAVVEWAGRPGHPSSYALLAGSLSSRPGVSIDAEEMPYPEALTGRHDDAQWGLPEEYRHAVREVLGRAAQPVVVTDAAHAFVGSSAMVFGAMAHLLCRVLAGSFPRDAAAVWRIVDESWDAATA